MITLELRSCLNHANLALLCHRRQAASQLADDFVFPVPQLLGIDFRLAEHDTVVRHGRRVIDDLGRVQQGF